MSRAVSEGKCPFCKGAARFWHVQDTYNYFGIDCEICKQFFITNNVVEKVNTAISNQVLNCIAENIRSNSKTGTEIVTSWHLESEQELPKMPNNITVKRYEVIAALPIVHSEKAEGLLMVLAQKAALLAPFNEVGLTLQDLYRLKISDFAEAYVWLMQLYKYGLIDSNYLQSQAMGRTHSNQILPQFRASITPNGWQQVFKNQQTLNSKKVFIAMQFKWEDELIEKKIKFIEALKIGCAECGYEAEIVSQDHADQITDRIVAEIKASKFVIADFTYNNQGAYYEAGLARGFGKKVIHTVMKGHSDDSNDSRKRLHFDIRQINYLEWDDPSEVSEKIKNRIRAVIED